MALPISIRIDGIDLRDHGFELIEYPDNLFGPPVTTTTLDLPSRHGVIETGYRYEPKEFSLSFQVRANSHSDAVAARDWLLQLTQRDAVNREYLVDGQRIRAHRLELAGHRYEYSTGTVSVDISTDTRKVTGTGTSWLNTVYPGAKIWIQGIGEKTVMSVESDTVLYTLEVLTASISGAAYYITQKWFLLVNSNGAGSVTTLGSGGFFQDRIFNVTIPFIAVYPFWIGDMFEVRKDGITDETFLEVVNAGNTFVQPIVEVTGVSSDGFKISTSKYATFLSLDSFSSYHRLNGVKNMLNESVTGSVVSAVKYHSRNSSVGIGLSGDIENDSADAVSFTSMANESTPSSGVSDRLDLNQGTIRVEFTPNWDGNDGEAHMIVDAGSSVFRLSKNSSNLLVLTVDGVSVSASATGIAAGNTYVVTGIWGTSGGSFFVDLYLDDARLDTDTGTASGSTLPSTLYIGSSVNGVNSADSVIHSVCIWNVPIETRGATPTDDLLDVCTSGTDPSSVVPEHILMLYDATDESAGSIATGYQDGDYALRFDGDNVYVDAPASDSFNFDQELTVEFWMKPEYKSGYQSVVDKVWRNGWGVLFYQNRKLSFHYAAGQGLAIASAFNWNEWVHVAFTFTTEEVKGYINGVFRSSEATGVNLTLTPTQPIRIGRNIGGIYQYLGEISYCRVYNRALTESEIQQLYAGQDPQDVISDYSTSCVLDYRFDRSSEYWDSTNKVVVDQSFAGNDSEDITTTGFTWNGSYPDELVRSWTGLVGQAGKPRQESVTAISSDEVTVGNADGFAVNDRVCVWDTDGNKVVGAISLIDFDEENEVWKITVSGSSSVSGTTRFISRNLVADPGIESTTAFWSTYNASISADTTYFYLDTQSLRVTNTSAANGRAMYSVSSVTEGEDYILSGWVRMNQSGTTTVVRVWDNTAGAAIAAISSAYFTPNEWGYFERVFEVPSGCTEIRIDLMVGTTTASDYTSFDGLQLVKQEITGDCESTGDWTAGNTTLSTTTGRNGGSALSVQATASGGRAYQTITPLNKGDWYLFKGWMKSSAAGHRVRLRITKSSDGSLVTSSDYVDSTDWTDYSVVFQMPSDSAGVIVNCQVESSGETGYFDDISLYRIEKVPLEIEPMDENYAIVPAHHGMGVVTDLSREIFVNDIIGSPYESTVTIRFKPLFNSSWSATEDIVLVKWRDDNSNDGYVLKFHPDANNPCFYFDVYSNTDMSSSPTFRVISNPVKFDDNPTMTGSVSSVSLSVDQWIEVTGVYSLSGTSKIYINGMDATLNSTGTETALVDLPKNLVIPAGAMVVVDEVLVAVKQLGEEEVSANYTEYESSSMSEFVFEPRMVEYESDLSSGDTVILDFENEQYKLIDVSSSASSSAISDCFNNLSSVSAKPMIYPSWDNRVWVYVKPNGSDGNIDVKIKFRPMKL